MKRFSLLLTMGTMWGALSVAASVNDLLPLPQSVESTRSGDFSLRRKITVNDPTSDPMLAEVAARIATPGSGVAGVINVAIVDSIPGAYDYPLAGYPNEAYTIKVSRDRIDITAVDPVGVKRAAATLDQLALGETSVAAVDITDWPAFKLRGWLHDVGRSFISIDELKHEIDLLSRFKVNTFHWHMTENQAWRFAVDAYPQLTSDSATVRLPGLYYTPAECRELEAYAYERGVTIIPEIDMPGHSQAFERAMGHSMQTPEGIGELTVILRQVAETFPLSTYLHIGGDEVAITYPNFLETMIAKVDSLGKRAVVWNPIRGVDVARLQGVSMVQLWGTAGRLIPGVANIDCRYNYANHFDTFADIAGIYNSTIYYADKGSPEIAGEISGYWNDRQLPDQREIINQNNFYAATIASGERAWRGGGEGYIEELGTTLRPGTKTFADFADFERRLLAYKDTWLANEPVPYMAQTNVVWRVTEPIANNGDFTTAFAPETEGPAKSYVIGGDTVKTVDVAGAGIYLNHVWPTIVPGLFPHTRDNATCYAWTWVYSPKARKANAYVEFQNYSRSERDLAPDAGQWDRKGSRLWINGKAIEPPVWENSGRPITNEDLLLNENASARKPLAVDLKKGWNLVMVKVPNNHPQGIRLNKWMFTFLLTDPAGRHALTDVTYATEPVGKPAKAKSQKSKVKSKE